MPRAPIVPDRRTVGSRSPSVWTAVMRGFARSEAAVRRSVLVLAVAASFGIARAFAEDPEETDPPVQTPAVAKAPAAPPPAIARPGAPVAPNPAPNVPRDVLDDLAGFSRGNNWVMLGDRGPLSAGSGRIKVSDNQSPRPQDRGYYSFNFFEDVNEDTNRRFQRPIKNMQVYRNLLGVEKTFLGGQGSIGLRCPLNSLDADRRLPQTSQWTGVSDTAIGDLDVISKVILFEDEEVGTLVSGGLAVTAPTGPTQFAGADYLDGFNSTVFQPYAAGIWNPGRFYLQGFSGLDVPADSRDVTLMYNDVGIGYFLRYDGPNDRARFVTMIAPTFEVHVNTPLNHDDPFDILDPAATADVVNLTYGVNIGIMDRGLLSIGIATPVTGPRPFDFEVLALFNYYFGTRLGRVPPVIGGY